MWNKIDDEPVWLEIGVRRAGSTESFNILSPRQRVTSAPHAAYASVAFKLQDGALTAAMFGSNVVPTTALEAGAVKGDKIADGAVVRSLNGLRDDVLIVPGEGLGMSTDAGRIYSMSSRAVAAGTKTVSGRSRATPWMAPSGWAPSTTGR